MLGTQAAETIVCGACPRGAAGRDGKFSRSNGMVNAANSSVLADLGNAPSDA